MIFIKDLCLTFGEQVVFNEITQTIQQNDRIGLVGRNGSGKSTLLKTIGKHISPDSGDISIPRNARVAYMPQEVVITSKKTVLEEALSTFDKLYALEREKNKLSHIIDTTEHPDGAIVERYAEIEHILLEENFEEKKSGATKMLTGLGFTKEKQATMVNELSVGWKMRIVLAKLLLQEADFYLFDEPTNHLDLSTKEWFLQFLRTSSFGYLLVCHDRYFLDKACTKTMELSQGNATLYHGNYSYYLKEKKIRDEQKEQAYYKQQQDIKQKQQTIDRFRSKASKAKMAQSMIKSLEKIDVIQLDQKLKTITIKLTAPARSSRQVLSIKNVAHSFNHELFKNVSFEIERCDKIALVAPNGTGKSTLFNLIAEKLPLQTGSIEMGDNVITALFDQDQEKVLDPEKTILEEVSSSCSASEREIRSILGAFLFSQDDIRKKTRVLSGGERNRVAMSKIILSKANFLLLDEPTNHLDIESKEVILQALKQFQGTIIFVSHDQDFVNKLATKIIELNTNGVVQHIGNYDDFLAVHQQQNLNETNKEKEKKVKPVNAANKKELYQLQKKYKNVENKIAKQEKEVAAISATMLDMDFESNEYVHAEQQIHELRNKLAIAAQQWEDLVKKIEKASK